MTAAGLDAVSLIAPDIARADSNNAGTDRRISHYAKGEIYVNQPGLPEGNPLTTCHMDFKPSWSTKDV